MTKEEFNIQDLGQFFKKEAPKVLVVLKNRLSVSTEDAEDIYQNACIALYNSIKKEKHKQLSCKRTTYFWRTRQTLWEECTDANPKLSLNDT